MLSRNARPDLLRACGIGREARRTAQNPEFYSLGHFAGHHHDNIPLGLDSLLTVKKHLWFI